ncbi:LysM peptidoglycan-binding domain-containing protein [Marinospirillum alkaliphilum]|uniref:LysM domain-containing protein n=1 Tax=Marinospirillum alkaliphilum DSM 21637 TaxID=1122209 RepID=A0A1K1ZXN8_9GAMM|nr:LysM domain-containing protein [Marinospirillum alkaliphilum]SFX78523.1 LysM domain-containing protein [Marinospirillum alkaliphilum DSM 21637]
MFTLGFRRLLLLVVVAGFSMMVQATSLKVDAPKRYEVQRGDSLWSIAERFLDDPWMWPHLWRANPQVQNPHLLYPGDIIELLQVDGRTVVQLRPRLRIMTLQEPIPFMPLEQVDAFLNRDVMIDRPDFEDALYIVGLSEERTLAGRGDQVQVLGSLTAGVTRYGIYRDLEEIRHPVTRQHLGFKARAIGVAYLVSDEDRMASFRIVESQEEIRVGDRLLPFTDSPFDAGFQPRPPAVALHGMVLRALAASEQQLIGPYQPIMLDLGSEQLQPGHMVEVLAPGRRVRNPQTGEVVFAAENPRGLAMVYRTFDHVSFALVLQSHQPMAPGDAFRQGPRR